MPLYKYQIIDENGKRTDGTMEAKNKFDLYHSIKKDGHTIVSTEEIKSQKLTWFLNLFSFLDSVKMHEKIIFARNLSKMIDAGLAITRAIYIMEKQSKGNFKKILGSINESLNKGVTLSDSMKNYPKVFSSLFISMVRAGEESGKLSMSLENVALQLEKTYQLNRKVRGALMYPLVIVCLMIVIGILMMIYMVPTLTSTFTGLGIELPLSTKAIIATSNFLVNYFIVFILSVIGLGVATTFALRTKKGQRFLDYTYLRIPVIGVMVKQINSARTARTLSSLLSSGVDIIVAIGVTRDVLQNSYYKEVMEEVQSTIQKGETMSKIFSHHQNLYPVFVTEMSSVGEETGKIGEMLMSVALFYEEEIDQKTKDMSSVIEPFLMIFIGLAVGFFAFSIISPIYSIGDSIG